MKAYIRRELSDYEYVQAIDTSILLDALIHPPMDPCYVKGPRGGLHQAVGGWDSKVAGPGADYRDPLSQRWVAVLTSETRYLRPRSRRWQEAKRMLGLT